MAFWDELNNGTYQAGPKQGSIEWLRANQATKKPQPQHKGNFFTDLIPTGGGIAGALGGAELGAGLGSIVPGVGTAIGGLLGGIAGGALGGGAGKVAENAVTGEQNLFNDVPQTALMSGALSAPPIRLAKGLVGGGMALAKGAGTSVAKQSLESALTKPGILANWGKTAMGEARGVGVGEKLNGSRIGYKQNQALNSFIQNVIKPKGLTSAKQLEGVEKFISERSNQLSGHIEQSNRALTTAEKNGIKKQLEASFSGVISPTSRQKGILNDIKTRIGQAKDVRELDMIRKTIDENINFARNAASPEPAAEQIYKQARKSLTDAVAERAGGAKSLKSQLSKAFDAQDLMLNHAGTGGGTARASSSSVASLPVPARATQAVQTLTGRGLGLLDKFPKTNMAGREALGGMSASIGNQANSLESALGQSADNTAPMTDSMTTANTMPNAISNMDSSYQNGGQMSSPYGEENLMYDIQRDPANADQYLAYYKQFQDIFAPQQQQKLNASQLQQANNANSALGDLSTVFNSVQNDPNVAFKDAIPGGSIARGLTGTTDYEAAKQNIVDVISRLRSGAAITADEAQRYMGLLPAVGDSQSSAVNKLQRLQSLLSSFANPQAASTSLQDVLTQGGGY